VNPFERDESSRRLSWLAIGALVWAFAIFCRLIQLQVVEHREYRRLAEIQQHKDVEIRAPRGTIFDRTGQELAMSVPMQSVSVNPKRVPNLSVATELIAPILEINPVDLYGRMKWAQDKGKGFLWIRRKISDRQYKRLSSLALDWIEFQTESQRHYPKDMVAAHVLGSVDQVENGNGGLELAQNEQLAGQPGTAKLLTDVHQRPIDEERFSTPVAGVNLFLTLDERIQFTAEQELEAAARTAGAATGSVVVMNPHTGELYALASYPRFDPNKPPKPGEDLSKRLNMAISAPFEPGSVFKVITLTAALETTNLKPESPINCGTAPFVFYGRVVHEAKDHYYGTMPMEMVLAKSSNVGALQVGLRVGQQNLNAYVRRMGFGASTGLPLPAESSGLVRRPEKWQATSIGSVAMGHEVSVTTVQLAQACSIIANGGFLVRPRLITARQTPGEAVEKEPEVPRLQVLKPETVTAMRMMMELVVRKGTGGRAKLNGYSSGGKTGSAQIFDFASKRYTHSYNASFIGFAPVTNPAIVVVVTLNGTHGTSGFGGAVSAPVFQAVAQETLRILEVPKDLPDAEAAPSVPAEVEDLAVAELSEPEIPEATPQTVLAQTGTALWTGPRVPDFRGKTMREVMERTSAMGLVLYPEGNGTARVQSPPAGTPLTEETVIRVRFSR
jgi:cell division protein FtsI (penicillin-binding protein 3)